MARGELPSMRRLCSRSVDHLEKCVAESGMQPHVLNAAPVAARIAGDLERAARTMVDALGADACREYVSGKSAEKAAGADSATKRAPFGIAADFEMGREAPEEIARLFERVARGGE